MPTDARPAAAWPTDALSFGGDYSPEQWPRETVLEDLRLMREVGVNLVTLGVFSWIKHEPLDGRFDFGWIDEMLDLLHANGIRVDLATPTAAVPMWLHRLHPEILPQDEFGHPLAPGGRNGFCPSSPVYRAFSLRIVEALAEHVADHPALAMWHVGNELGGGNARCHCPVSNEHFRRWVQHRYGTVDALNEAWGMSFWGNSYSSFEEVTTPSSKTAHNPGQLLDYERFSSEALLDQYLAEKAVLRRHTPAVPVTTNFMVGLGPDVVDYARWAPHVDIVANDHYTYGPDPLRHQELAFSGDRMRGISGGGPWMLMEHAAGAASWHAINQAKKPGELIRHALAHLARGSDSVMYFQWRASKSGTEQFHSAMLPHAGRDSRIFRDITTLGGHLGRLAEVTGSTVAGAQVALLHDNEAGWALKSGLKPTNNPVYADTARAIHSALFEKAVTVDVLPAWHDLAGYKLVVVPGLFLVSAENAQAVADFARAGGTVVVTWFSGIVDERNTVITGGYPGAFRDLLGAWSEEFYPLTPDETVELDNGWSGMRSSELVHAPDAEVIARYSSGDVAGYPAVTRRAFDGGGSAWYLSTDLHPAGLAEFLDRVLDESGVTPAARVSPGVEAVRRTSAAGSYLFLLNHTATEGWAEASGTDLLTGHRCEARVPLPAGGVAVIRED
ncbi:beta-galactosidase [Cryobacterium sp. SO2]|uniref:beta-galactosidase n=1 Tax=Cryobacterium sp. SO2 TaxID=1897060 RepID=UPI00223E40E9|nr:beta-galactosidase [Cryobacterium sp. SO2]WEO77420.1 beta-galactosidase [Cryobacterium sp. SO2]